MSEWLEQVAAESKRRRESSEPENESLTLRLTIDVEMDEIFANSARSNDKGERDWFYGELLGDPELFLHSNLIGDSIGTVRVVHIHPNRTWERQESPEPENQLTDFDWIQIEQAARGCISGTSDEWPALVRAIEKLTGSKLQHRQSASWLHGFCACALAMRNSEPADSDKSKPAAEQCRHGNDAETCDKCLFAWQAKYGGP